jgi:hypothetical protein
MFPLVYVFCAVYGRFSPISSVSLANSVQRLLYNHYHPSSGAGAVGQTVAEVPSGLSLTPPRETKTDKAAEDCK